MDIECVKSQLFLYILFQKRVKRTGGGVVMPPWAVKVGSMGRGIVYRMSKKPAVFAHILLQKCVK